MNDYDQSHDMSKGLQKSMPVGYSELGHYRKKRISIGWVLLELGFVGWVLWGVL